MREVCVVGAGWAGLTAARRLHAAGRDVVVLEKARGPGGRCSTRRQEDFAFDHGAQYFTARSDAFSEAVRGWKAQGLLRAWNPRITVFGPRPSDAGRSPDERLVGLPGMNGVLKHLAAGLDCRFGVRVERLGRNDGCWVIGTDASGQEVRARYLLMTAPPQQAAALLSNLSDLAPAVAKVPMNPCWAMMLGFDQAIEADFDAAFDNEGPLAWLARNSSKPGRSGEAWVLHASPDWSGWHLEDDAASVAGKLLDAFRQRVPAARSLQPRVASAHRWRYALAPEPLKRSCLSDAGAGLVVAGDWCAGNRIEGAWTSGMASAEEILAWG